jgi:hypothetical protein
MNRQSSIARRRSRRYALLIVLLVLLTAVFAVAAAAEPEEDPGPVTGDQSEIVGDDTVYGTARPTPQSANGPAPTGTYTREHWPEDATGAADGIDVVHSTAPGTFALTGVVIDQATGESVPGASAIIHGTTFSPPCEEPCIPISRPFAVSTTSDSKGAFAFIHMPNAYGGQLHLTVNKQNYGTYTLENVSAVELNNAHVVTVALSSEAQMFDAGAPRDENPERISADDGAPVESTTSFTQAANSPSYPSIRGYRSQTRPPPVISVWMYPIPRGVRCPIKQTNPDGSHKGGVWVAPWRQYLLATMAGEIGGTFPPSVGRPTFGPVASAAVGEAIHSFAWWYRQRPNQAEQPGADISNTFQQHQCTNPALPLDSDWNRLLTSRIHNHRIARDGDPGSVYKAKYVDGRFECPDDSSISEPSENRLGQKSTKAWEENCGRNNFDTNVDWQFLVNRWYSVASVRDSLKPIVPKTRFFHIPGGIWFEFHSIVGNRNVAWKYFLERSETGNPNTWRQFKVVGFENRLKDVRQEYKHFPGDGRCWFYRVRAWNPVGAQPESAAKTDAGQFNNGNCIRRG